ncbi:Response regulator receiver domain-containing protein [Dehalogenimonas formicexedens]|uniref:Response regulator receiver domain-containing protein n=1 Tax=Dehalogenimonas formicexedens TaxID=1839801 RepID=A0A1P8F902_9CHLR|nr:response regulator [Dehalogenimonas formicexedens]APV44944.1 Response regulator receiver domain-containing protein [Dehalogenimonas formicexedens]
MTAKILVADDQAPIRNLITTILSKDYQVIQAASGTDALRMIRQEKPDLVITDILMPGMDGLAVCTQIKADPATSKIPVVMLTIIDYDLNRRFAENLGADGYLTKPFTPDQLKEAVSRHLAAASPGTKPAE